MKFFFFMEFGRYFCSKFQIVHIYMEIRKFVWLLWGGLLGAAACSEGNTEEMPRPERHPDTVIIGCAETGAGIETRTALGEDGLAVQGESGD